MSSDGESHSLTASAVSGASWMFAATVTGRAASFGGQIAMGWLLRPEDFGVWALALSMASAVTALRNGGTTQILIQRRERYHGEAGLFLRYSLAFNLLALVVLVALAMPSVRAGHAVGLVLLGIGVSIPFSTPAMLYRAKLTLERRFREIALITLGSSLAWQAGALSLAIGGLGALSFAAAPVLQASFETLAGRAYAGGVPGTRVRYAPEKYLALFKESIWGVISAAALSLATTGNYLVIAILTSARTVGIYYFGYQMVVALSMPIYTGIDAVLPTLLTSLDPDRTRQMEALARALGAVLVTAIPAALAFILAAAPVIHFLWHGRWDAAVPVAQALAWCVPAWLAIHCGRSLLEARGYWRMRFLVQCTYGIGGMAFAALGARSGEVGDIAVSVALFYVVFAVVFALALCRLGLGIRRLISVCLGPIAVSGAALAISWAVPAFALRGRSGYLQDWIELSVFLALSLLGNILFFRRTWTELLGTLASRVLRIGAGASRLSAA